MARSLSRLSQVTPGGHELRREVVVHHQRERILTAVLELAAENGYRSTSVALVIKRAGVAKLKFYELFDSKQDAFLAAFDQGLAEAAQRVGEASGAAADEDLAARLDAGLGALLSFLEQRPTLARAAVLEAPQLGTAMGDRRERALAAFHPMLSGAEDAEGERMPEGLAETVLEGLYTLLHEAVLIGKPRRLTRLRPALVEFALLPFLGPAAPPAVAKS